MIEALFIFHSMLPPSPLLKSPLRLVVLFWGRAQLFTNQVIQFYVQKPNVLSIDSMWLHVNRMYNVNVSKTLLRRWQRVSRSTALGVNEDQIYF